MRTNRVRMDRATSRGSVSVLPCDVIRLYQLIIRRSINAE